MYFIMEFKREDFLHLVKLNDIEGILRKIEQENRPFDCEQIRICIK